MFASLPRPHRRAALLGGLLVAAVMGTLLVSRVLPSHSPSMARQPAATARVENRLPGASMWRGTESLVKSKQPRLGPNALFAYVDTGDVALLDEALPAPAREIHYVRLNVALLTGARSPFWQKSGEGRVELPLPGGDALTVVIDASELLGVGRFTSSGHLDGRPQSRAIFAGNEGFLHATISDPDLGSYALRVATADLSQFYRVDPALVPGCGGGIVPAAAIRSLATDAARHTRAAGPIAATGSPAAGAIVTATAAAQEVHVMMLYTQAVLPTLTGPARTAALQSAFDAVIAKVNSDFANSLVATRVKLVKIAETQYNESVSAPSNIQNDALTALQSSTDGKMDEIHTLRDQVGADLVCLSLNRSDSSSSGLAFLLDARGDRTNPLFGFAVVTYGFVAGTSVVPHELGHTLGCAHDRANSGVPGAYPYSYGYTFVATNGQRYHDIMAYPPGTELAYFSNPAMNAPSPAPANSPGGVAAGQAGESNCALTIDNNAAEVAGYRAAVFAITTQPASAVASVGGNVTFSIAATAASGGAAPTYQWQLNGTSLAGATSTTLTVADVQPASTGLYTAIVTSGATTASEAAVLGVATSSKVAGAGTELQPANIPHPNGNTFDQVLVTGAAETITADANQITRTSFIDLNGDIVQVEFTGAGALSLVLDAPTGPAVPANYNQAVSYMKGHAGIVVTGANETTNLSIFSVGRITAFDPTGAYDFLQPVSATNNPANNGSSLFTGHAGTAYDGVADIAFIAISSANGKFGGLRASDASCFATKGLTGIYAPGVAFSGPVYLSDINADAAGTATPVFIIGSSSDTRITGGDLLQGNGQPVKVAGLTQLKFTAGVTSNNVTLPAKTNRAVLQQNGVDVTTQVVVNQAP